MGGIVINEMKEIKLTYKISHSNNGRKLNQSFLDASCKYFLANKFVTKLFTYYDNNNTVSFTANHSPNTPHTTLEPGSIHKVSSPLVSLRWGGECYKLKQRFVISCN